MGGLDHLESRVLRGDRGAATAYPQAVFGKLTPSVADGTRLLSEHDLANPDARRAAPKRARVD
jgi:hypothetical protein